MEQCQEPLCQACALRMSMLFGTRAPKTLMQVQNETTGSTDPLLPLLDTTHHKRFVIVYETVTSARRYLQNLRPAEAEEGPQRVKSLCTDGMFGGESAPRASVTYLCVACAGLFQFLDLVHVPLVAAAVRVSPFSDSRAVTVNINVNRSVTFLWLMAATRYYDTAGTDAFPAPTDVVPEEFCNFKDMFGGDLRARVMLYLRPSHTDVLAKEPALPGIELYRETVASGTGSAPLLKRQRTEQGEGEGERRTAVQALTYDMEGQSLIAEVYCRHRPSEFLLTERVLPSEYCSNRTALMTYDLLYTSVRPSFLARGLAPPLRDAEGGSGGAVLPAVREAASVSTETSHANIYLMGNYRKMQRNLSQSPWFYNDVRIGSFSLQEVIANPVLPFFFPEGVTPVAPPPAPPPARAAPPGGGEPARELRPNQQQRHGLQGSAHSGPDPAVASAREVFGYGRYKFHSAGREDVDVRMLGTGRPFVLELLSPSREQVSEADLARLEVLINENEGGSVEVERLRVTDAQVTVRLARHSESKVKKYRCVVWCERALSGPDDPVLQRLHALHDIVIEQKTPLRVLHRRSLHARPRTIHAIKATPLGPHWMLVDLDTQAGTYVKEFVHGDLGRTLPNLGSLMGCRADIIQLDVLGMEMHDLDLPPPSTE